MINLRLQGSGAFRLGFERPLKIIQERSQTCEATFNGSIELSATPLGGTLSNRLL